MKQIHISTKKDTARVIMASSLRAFSKSNLIDQTSVLKCGVSNCQEKAATFSFDTCGHVVCTRCLVKSRTSQDNTNICVCPLCKNCRYSAWIEFDTLVRKVSCMNYCGACLSEKAIFKSNCGHLFCGSCLEILASTPLPVCNVLECQEQLPSAELKGCLKQKMDILVWRTFEISNKQEKCDELCGNRAVVKVKSCSHCYCFPCADLKLLKNENCTSEDIACLERTCCDTWIPKQLLEFFLKMFKEIPVMTAVSIKVSDEKCYNRKCNDGSIKTIRIRNKSCSFLHAFCINCFEEKLRCSDVVSEPYMQSNCIEDLIVCDCPCCKSRTPVKCLKAVIDVIKGQDWTKEIFLRKAVFQEECDQCKNAEAFATCMHCSHGYCFDCMKDISERRDKEYHVCDVAYCMCRVPIAVFQGFLKRTLKNETNLDFSDQRIEQRDKPNISVEMSIDKKNRILLLNAEIETKSNVNMHEWMKDGKPLKMNDGIKYEEKGTLTNTPQLKISNIGKEDEGKYTLTAKNAYYTASSNCVEFCVEKASPSVSIKTEFGDNHQRGNIIVDIITEWPIERVHWLNNGRKINLSDVGKKIIENKISDQENQRTLSINDFRKQDEGSYSCEVETLGGKGKSASILMKFPRVVPSVSLSLIFNEKNHSLLLCAEIVSNLKTKAPKWMKDGKQICLNKQPKKYFESRHLLTKPSLTIFDVGKADEGMYKVSIENEYGPGISETKVFRIPKDPPKLLLSFVHNIHEKCFTVVAEIESRWPLLISKWQKDGIDLILFQNMTEVFDSTRRTLVIKNFTAKDIGRYKFIAESVAGRGESTEIELKIPDVLPKVTMEMFVLKKEEKLKFLTTIHSESPLKDVRWLANDKFIDERRLCKYRIEKGGNEYTLYVNDVTQDDEGVYRAVVENRAGTNSSQAITFNFSGENPKVSLTQTAEKHTVELNGLIESSWPIKKRIWQRDGLNLPKLPGKYDVTETKLRINKITKQDEGLYRLCVQSTAGIGKSKQIQISIETEPGSSTYNRNSNQSTPRNEVLTKSNTKVEQETVQAMQSSLVKIQRPYTHRVKCEICNKTAIATFENCKDSYCLECLQCVAGTCTTSTIKCPKTGDCSSYITVETFARFLKIPYTLNIEMPLYFEVSLGKCMCSGCYNEGVIKMTNCFHSLCLPCLRKCSIMTKCPGFACVNKEIPPQRYFQYLESALDDKKQPAFLLDVKTMYPGDCRTEITKCSTCIEKASFEIIRCTHKFCDRCYGRSQSICGVSFLIRKCAVNGCHELYPFPCEQTKRLKNVEQSEEILYERDGTAKSWDIPDERKNTNIIKRVLANSSYGTSKGLSNIAFSCYRNSILQDESWIFLLKEILVCIRSQTTGGREMLELLRHFHHLFNITNSGYREYQQEDTLSFLTTVLNGINDEYEKEGKGYQQMKNPLNIFKGRLLDKFCCKDCKQEESFSESDFLSVPLPKEANIEQSLLGFLEEEEMDIFPCSSCGSTRVCKRLEISRYPDVLVLQLNKSAYSTGLRTSKTVFHETLKESLDIDVFKKIKKEDIDSYKLYGVVVHHGSDSSGHYICYVRRSHTSMFDKCDDSFVSQVRVQDVLQSDAYLLFYEKCDSAV
ncbi:uncharacterized protein LOC134246166 isoform X3 [Saccostrea cucullata]|uniref:uncharacterized protein LOC134246166 isoform X3 n=1 Tax=Saccostrea cuccullata TaxID=36930 RepID=UPI002ED56843